MAPRKKPARAANPTATPKSRRTKTAQKAASPKPRTAKAATASPKPEPREAKIASAIASAQNAMAARLFLPNRVVLDREGDAFPSTRLDEHARDEGVLPSIMLADIRGHAREGERLLLTDDAAGAFRSFLAGLELVPPPLENWNAAGWLLVAMGECAIHAGDFARAFPPLRDAMHCPGTIGNPWVHLRLGQTRFELGDERAADELARAYMGGGRDIFVGLDPKYFALVESVLDPHRVTTTCRDDLVLACARDRSKRSLSVIQLTNDHWKLFESPDGHQLK